MRALPRILGASVALSFHVACAASTDGPDWRVTLDGDDVLAEPWVAFEDASAPRANVNAPLSRVDVWFPLGAVDELEPIANPHLHVVLEHMNVELPREGIREKRFYDGCKTRARAAVCAGAGCSARDVDFGALEGSYVVERGSASIGEQTTDDAVFITELSVVNERIAIDSRHTPFVLAKPEDT